MPYAICFGLLITGYTLVVWGHYVQKSERVSMWYLLSGLGPRDGGPVSSSSDSGSAVSPVGPGGRTDPSGRSFNPRGNPGNL